MDCIMRKSPLALAHPIRCLPPAVSTQRVGTICTHPLASSLSRCRIRLTYCFGSLLSVKTKTTSSTTKYHFSSVSFQTVLICLLSNNLIVLILYYFEIKRYSIHHRPSGYAHSMHKSSICYCIPTVALPLSYLTNIFGRRSFYFIFLQS